ncbi:hypothetical protein OKW96_11145 [Sphingobacterium sp. KU25419]|nr:hypothetical protein OKW96_11145 [Sphingobacterium sp. KU25419]
MSDLFDPEWGTYDMAVGEQIVSVFCGAADKEAYEQGVAVSANKTIIQQQDEIGQAKNNLYSLIRHRRIGESPISLTEIYEMIVKHFPIDWLAYIETLELAIHDQENRLAKQIENRLQEIISDHKHLSKLVLDGIQLAKNDQIALIPTE